MSLDLSKVVTQAFAAIGGAIGGTVKTATYRSVGAQTYNPTTGALSSTVTEYPVKVILLSYNRREKEVDLHGSRRGAIEYGDQKALIAYEELPITTSLEDTILIGTSVWRIVDLGLDPTGTALHTLQLRRA